MKKPILTVDCDLTVCPSDVGWANYLKYFNGFGKVVHRTDGMLEYDLSKMYPTVADPYEYWRTLDYDQFEPIGGSVETLEALSKYFDIAFISQAKGTHHKNKYYWLKEHFPFNVGVLLTKEKHLMKGSVVAHIEDRLEHLQGFDYDQRVLFETNYTQTADCKVRYRFSDWANFDMVEFCRIYL